MSRLPRMEPTQLLEQIDREGTTAYPDGGPRVRSRAAELADTSLAALTPDKEGGNVK